MLVLAERPTTVSIELNASLLAPAAARARLDQCRQLLAPDRFHDLRLIVSELVLNSAVHGPSGEAILVTLEIGDRWIRGKVTDRGDGFLPPTRPSMDRHAGNGLLIVDALAHRWGVDHGRPTTVWFEYSYK